MPQQVDAALFDRISDGIFVVDREWRYVFVNEAATKMVGLDAGELIGKTIWERFPEITGSVFERNFRWSLREQEPVEFEDYYEGLGRWYTVRVFPSPDGLTINFQDSSARHAADRALDVLLAQSRRQQRLATVLAEANEAVFRAGTPEELFEAAVRIAVEHGGFVMSWIGLVDRDDGVVVPLSSAGAAASEYLKNIEINVRGGPAGMGPAGMATRSGVPVCSNDILVDANMAPWRAAAERVGYRSSGAFPMLVGGKVAALLSVYAAEPGYFDTEEISLVRRLAANVSYGWESLLRESALRESEVAFRTAQRLRAVVSAAPDAIIGVNPEGVIELANARAERLFAASATELARVPIEALVPSVASHWDDTGHLRDGEQERRSLEGLELTAVRRDGTTFPAEVALSRVEETPGRSLVLASVRDLTERFELEEERRQRALEAQREQADRLDSLGLLAGGIAHDFNNLLGIILNYTSLLKKQVRESQAAADLQEIRSAAQRAAELTRQLLTFARRDPAHPEPLDVNASVRSVTSMLARTLPSTVKLRLELDARPLVAVADRHQLDQVLVNLVINARDAMADGGTVTVSTSTAEADGAAELVAIAVHDTGHGMTPEVQARAFEPFYTTKPRGEGTGLGLAAVYGIVDRSGGAVRLDSAPGEGTTVTVMLPRAPQDGKLAPVPRPHGALGGGELVLVVEDDPTLREATARIVAAGGFGVLAAADGLEALALLEERSDIALVLTDVVMPKMRGDELARAVRANKPGVRIVMMTGHDAGNAPPSERVLHKPTGEQELLSALREALDG